MVKRYVGGLISGTPQSFTYNSAPGIWNTSEHLRYKKLGTWPSLGFIKTGTTSYDVTGMGTYVHVDNLIAEMTASGAYSFLPDTGFLKYNIKTGASTFQAITVFYVKSGSQFTQSAFSLLGQTLGYSAGTSTLLNYANDDHDSLVMDADGKGVISRGNTGTVTGNWDKFQGSTEVLTNGTVDSIFNFAPSSFIGSNVATIVSFPKTGSAVWLNIGASTYKTNNYNSVAMPTAMSQLGTASPTTSLFSISDGVNSFILGRAGNTTAAYCVVDLSTGVITATAITITNPTLTNGTEEDAFGDQLFLVDGRTTFFSNGNFYYGGTRYWRSSTPAWSDTAGMTAFAAGNSTQNGMDIFGSVDASGWVWFADWGHDDGGLFGVGNDSQLGTRPTNIKMVPNTYTN